MHCAYQNYVHAIKVHASLLYAYLNYPQRPHGRFYNVAKFGLTDAGGFDHMELQKFCEYGLKMPIHSPI